MGRIFFAALMMLAITGCGEDLNSPVTIKVPQEATNRDRIIIDGATKILFAVCPKVREYWSDFTTPRYDINPEFVAENLGADQTRGWGRTFHLFVTVIQKPQHFPKEMWVGGHTLAFLMGGGDQPGIYVVKDQTAHLCDLEHGEMFMDVPELGFIQ